MDENKTSNVLIGQSGGPTAAINATLSGIIKGLRRQSDCGRIYGAMNGIDGVINGNIREIGPLFKNENDFYALECTPAAVLGSCRRKLPDISDTAFYEKIFMVFAEYSIKIFLLIGGNDSMDTVAKLSEYAKRNNRCISIIGVPKTIDNDLEITDHTPGYGSAAKYVATCSEEIARDCTVYTMKAVTIIEVMGRDSGWLTAAAALPRLYGQCCADLVYLPEVPFDYNNFIEDINEIFKTKPNVVVAVSEGARDKEGRYIGENSQSGDTDIFGHKYLAGAGKVLEEIVRLRIGCKVRSIELSLPQRCAGHCLSKTDIEESVLIGAKAAEYAFSGKTGDFAIFKRISSDEYGVYVDFVPVEMVANKVKKVSVDCINERGNNVTEDLLRDLAPLIMGNVEIPTEGGLPKHFTIR